MEMSQTEELEACEILLDDAASRAGCAKAIILQFIIDMARLEAALQRTKAQLRSDADEREAAVTVS